MISVEIEVGERIRQGDVYSNIEYVEYATEKEGIVEISKIEFPLVIVLTQDCDLQQDHSFRHGGPAKETQDKYLLSVLVAPLFNVEHFYDGSHLSDIERTMEPFERRAHKTKNKYFKQNEVPRYHYLEFPDSVPIVPSVIDFKLYFSLDVVHLMNARAGRFVCKVSELYREDISQRFASFLSRIGLPETRT